MLKFVKKMGWMTALVCLLSAQVWAHETKVDPIFSNGSSVKMIKRVSLLARKPGQTHEEFVKHWLNVHAPIAHQIPGIARYACTEIITSSTRKDGPLPIDLEIDGIAEMWFMDQASLNQAVASEAFKALRADGAAFIGREIDFVTNEFVIVPK